MENIQISRFILAAGAILLALALWGAWGLWRDAEAHGFYWRWDAGNVTPRVTSTNNPYGSAARSASNDYDSNTDITVDWCNWPCSSFNIRFVGDNFGETGWVGKANPMHNGVSCVINRVWSSARCNKTDRQANSATISWNSHYPGQTSRFANHVARHELGHVFGLIHHSCGISSVMVTCNNYPTTLTSHDITDMDNEY